MTKHLLHKQSMLATALGKINEAVHEGVRHGHFDLHISGRICTKGTRELLIKAGKNHRYLIVEDELNQSAS
jgi:hypothetical protein